ncbi:MAG: UDP-3-O-acyl N-acetylglucosamine deacetylase [Candidatus Marinamargulisbacteria bacterium]|jgi:UDP-3-O-acyl N-acetylglucosamine deacetylase
MNPKTLDSPAHFRGVGIHSGKTVSVTCHPASENTGIQFRRTDLDGAIVKVCPRNISATKRATHLTENNVTIKTPEHLLAACAGLGISNALIDLDGEEIPILDGSARPFSNAFLASGIKSQPGTLEPIKIHTPITVSNGPATIMILPSDEAKISYVLDLSPSFVGTQVFTSPISTDDFLSEIASARTFGFESEVKALLEKGLALGGSLDNALIIGETEYLSDLRFKDELVRHKILDMFGDLWILNRPIIGHIIGVKSGHFLNTKLVKAVSSAYL